MRSPSLPRPLPAAIGWTSSAAEARARSAGGAWRGSVTLPARAALFPALLLAVGLAVRAVEARGALLYPDGYQYLLMARGIGDDLRPIVRLGRGGELFVPNADAALKPLFPALVALVHLGGVRLTGAARLVSVTAGGASFVLCGILAARLSGSRILGSLAALLVLFDPLDRYWASFSSPDELGQALMLGAVLAALAGRARVCGVVAALAAFARPELGLLLVAAGVVLASRPRHRLAALRFLTAAFATAALVLALLRPPLVLEPGQVGLAALGAIAAAAIALLAPPRLGVVVGLAAMAVAAARDTALGQLAVHDLPISLACLTGLLVARRERAAGVVSMALGSLALIYDWKNGASTRYVVELLPLAAIGAAIGASALAASRLRPLLLPAAAAAVGLVASTAPAPAPGPDMFGTIARELPRSGRAIVTAAPDAYGFLLYPRPVRALQPGASGLLLDDAVARAYEPQISFHGRVVARLSPGNGFLDPSGRTDLAPALLVAGIARERAADATTAPGIVSRTQRVGEAPPAKAGAAAAVRAGRSAP